MKKLRRHKKKNQRLQGVRILFSTTDKGKLEAWTPLWENGAKFVSVGGTLKHLRKEVGVTVTPIEHFTGGQGECLDGLVKTLDESVFKACLANRANPKHMFDLENSEVDPIDIVVMNQYNWEDGVKKGLSGSELIRQHFDVGGNCVPLAALKGGRAVVMDPADYDRVVSEMLESGRVSEETRDYLFRKALASIIQALGKIHHWAEMQVVQDKRLFA